MLIHQAALGDFVVTWPLLRAWSPVKTCVVAPLSKARLAASEFPHVMPSDIESPVWSSLFGQGDSCRPAFEVELIVSFVSNEGDAFTRHMRDFWPSAKIVCVTPRAPAEWRGHVHDWHVAQLRAAGVTVRAGLPALRSNAAGPVVVHPGAGGESKRWPADRFEQLIAQLRGRGVSVRVIMGEAEFDGPGAAELMRFLHEENVACESLLQLADRIRGARLFIGNDSGPTHLAAQLGVPTLALFGPTSPDNWRPLGPAVRVLSPAASAPMTWLSVDEAMEAALRVLVE